MNLKEEAINQNLIDAIKSNIKGSVIQALSDILPLSKEAIYRRLRGDVLFTFSEASLIAKTLNMSLDEVSMMQGEYLLADNKIKIGNLFDLQSYHDKLAKWIEILQYYTNKPESQTYAIVNEHLLPLFSPFRESQLKLVYFKTLFENGALDEVYSKFSDIKIPQSILDQFRLGSEIIRNNNITCIIGSNTFRYYLKKIEYMKMLDLIEDSEVEEIKADLFDSLNYLKDVCKTGRYPSGKAFEAYICEINVNTPFAIWEEGQTSTLFLRQLGLNYTIFTDQDIINQYKQVFNNLKNFSTLISGSGSVRRLSYFKEQLALFE